MADQSRASDNEAQVRDNGGNLSQGDADRKTRYGVVLRALEEAFGPELQAVILFGSQARRTARPESDHDLLVVIEGLPREPLARQRAVRMALLPVLEHLPGRVTLVAKTPDEMAANLTPLLLDVCVDGVCLRGEAYFEPYRRKALAALAQSGLRRRWSGGALIWSFPKIPRRGWELSWEGYREDL